MQNLHDRFIARLGARGQGFVKALPPKPSTVGDCCHPASLGDIRNGCEKYIWVLIFQGGRKVLCNQLFILQIISCIEFFKTTHLLYPRTSSSEIWPARYPFFGYFLYHRLKPRAGLFPVS